MKKNLFLLTLTAFLGMWACNNDNSNPEPNQNEEVKEEFYMEIALNDSNYRISNKGYKLEIGGGSRLCSNNQPFVSGYSSFSLQDSAYKKQLKSVNFFLSKKVFKRTLDSTVESSYMNNLLTSKEFGFPVNKNGFYTVWDIEDESFEVSEDVIAEGFLWIVTKDGQVYSSTSSQTSNPRDNDSYLIINKVIENQNPEDTTYGYIVEGKFKVNLFNGYYSSESEIAEGTFRWPIGNVKTSELFKQCKK